MADFAGSDDPFVMNRTIVGGRIKKNQYRLTRKLGSGSFGEVYEAQNVENGEKVAVKLQCKRLRGANLPKESSVYKKLLGSLKRTKQGIVGVPQIRWYGEHKEHYVLVMDLLGPSLLEYYEQCGRKFSAKSTSMLAIDMIHRLEALHKSGFVHCDVKPENFAMGLPDTAETDCVFLFDLGLAFQWRETGTGKHVPHRADKTGMTGTCRYASIHSHMGCEHARRNDMESLAYVLLFLHRGSLPWQGFAGSDATRRRKVLQKKHGTSADELCRGCPAEFASYTKYVRGLAFDKCPDYAKCRKYFQAVLDRLNTVFDHAYDWKQAPVSGKRPLDLYLPEPDTKRMKMNPPISALLATVLQYMVVTTVDPTPGMRQQWTSSTSYQTMVKWIENNWKDPMWRISSSGLCVSGPAWICVLSYNTGLIEQSIKQSRWFLPDDWIKKKWGHGFWITAASGRNTNAVGGCTVVVMSTNCGYTQQVYYISNDFPGEWVKEKWGQGYYITSIATRDDRWAVVMSTGSKISQQCYEVDSGYPSKRIHERWRQGYYITCIGGTSKQVAYVLSKEKGQRSKSVVPQCSHRSSQWPRDRISDDWKKNQFVSAIAYGRTM